MSLIGSCGRRRDTRYRFLKAAIQEPQQPASWFDHWFGIRESPAAFLEPGVRAAVAKSLKAQDQKGWMTQVLELLGITGNSVEELWGAHQPRSDFLDELDNYNSWLPASMQQLLKPECFPDACLLVEFQVGYLVGLNHSNKLL